MWLTTEVNTLCSALEWIEQECLFQLWRHVSNCSNNGHHTSAQQRESSLSSGIVMNPFQSCLLKHSDVSLVEAYVTAIKMREMSPPLQFDKIRGDITATKIDTSLKSPHIHKVTIASCPIESTIWHRTRPIMLSSCYPAFERNAHGAIQVCKDSFRRSFSITDDGQGIHRLISAIDDLYVYDDCWNHKGTGDSLTLELSKDPWWKTPSNYSSDLQQYYAYAIYCRATIRIRFNVILDCSKTIVSFTLWLE